MPPKAEEAAKPKKAKDEPMEPCGCGVNTWRKCPKGKKVPPPIVHLPTCTFQRAVCSRYPNLPKCQACETGCDYCCGTNPWCPHCIDNKCKFMYKRDVLGWADKSTSGDAALAAQRAKSEFGASATGQAVTVVPK